jgi:uncharacterized membrane protein YsdA (DUF1294 family)
MEFFILYLCIVNALGFAVMLADKRKAIKKQWRIPERTLIGVALIGGSLGSLLGMYICRHKTQHAVFTVGIPLILTLQVTAILFLLRP